MKNIIEEKYKDYSFSSEFPDLYHVLLYESGGDHATYAKILGYDSLDDFTADYNAFNVKYLNKFHLTDIQKSLLNKIIESTETINKLTEKQLENHPSYPGRIWRIETRGGGQIGDTGDYDDPYYVLTNGIIELVTKDDIAEMADDALVEILNELGVKWEDWKLSDAQYELYLEKENCKKWKEIAKELMESLECYTECADNESDKAVQKAMNNYKTAFNNLP